MNLIYAFVLITLFSQPLFSQQDPHDMFDITPGHLYTCHSLEKTPSGDSVYTAEYYTRAYGLKLFFKPWLLFRENYLHLYKSTGQTQDLIESIDGNESFSMFYEGSLASKTVVEAFTSKVPNFSDFIFSFKTTIPGFNFSFAKTSGDFYRVDIFVIVTPKVKNPIQMSCSIEPID